MLVKNSDKQSNQESIIQLKTLVQECKDKANEIKLKIKSKGRITNTQYYGSYGIMKNEILMSRSIQEVIRTIDSKENERSHSVKKLGYKYDFVDTKARSCL